MTLVLASRSPQRRAILQQLGVPFVERAVDVREEDAGAPAADAGEYALRKALAATCVLGVLAACGGDDDTVTPPVTPPVARPAGSLRSLGADGWAAVGRVEGRGDGHGVHEDSAAVIRW